MLLEHHPAPEAGEGAETLDLVRIAADGSPHWLGVWPTAEDNPRHAGLELWMAVHELVIEGPSYRQRQKPSINGHATGVPVDDEKGNPHDHS